MDGNGPSGCSKAGVQTFPHLGDFSSLSFPHPPGRGPARACLADEVLFEGLYTQERYLAYPCLFHNENMNCIEIPKSSLRLNGTQHSKVWDCTPWHNFIGVDHTNSN